MQPKASVIIPMYNAADHIGQCVSSILAQTMADFEVICVDDGSTDDTVAVVDGLARSDEQGRVRLIEQENAGPGAARNAGLASARGEYVYCLDADDFAERELLERCIEAIEAADADMALFAFRTFNEKAGRAFPAPWGMQNLEAFPTSAQGSFDWQANPDLFFEVVQNIPWNKVIRRSVLVENGIGFQELYLSEDAMYSIPAAVCSRRIVRLTKPLMCHREFGEGNLMAAKDRHPIDFLEAFAELRIWLEQRGAYAQLRSAWRQWLLNAVYYNLPTYRSFEAFCAAYELLCDDGLRTFDLRELDSSQIRHAHYRVLHEALLSNSRERFLLACANCGFESALDEKCYFQDMQTPTAAVRAELSEGLRTQDSPFYVVLRTARDIVRSQS